MSGGPDLSIVAFVSDDSVGMRGLDSILSKPIERRTKSHVEGEISAMLR